MKPTPSEIKRHKRRIKLALEILLDMMRAIHKKHESADAALYCDISEMYDVLANISEAAEMIGVSCHEKLEKI